MSEELTWEQKKAAGIKASLEKKKTQEQVEELESLRLEVIALRREVAAIKEAHNALLAALEEGPSRSSTTYTSYFVGDF
jgi:hypothetical protein